MTFVVYAQIWEKVVLPVYANISGGAPFLYLRPHSRLRIYRRYNAIIENTEKAVYGAGTEHIDSHKIAAVMLKAIMEVYPVRISVRHILRLWRRKEPLAEKYIYANETLALYTTLSIVENFSACTADGTPATAHSPITLPATFNDSHYDLNTYIDLYFSKRTKQINILTFANVFFLLEKLSKKENC